jgi:RNA-directed DNA polymerase
MLENREALWSPVLVDDAPSGMVRGVADRRVGGPRGERRGGNPSMNGRRESDGRVVPQKPSNNPGGPGAEVVEGRRPAKGNAASETRPGRGAGLGVSSDLDRVRQVARRDKQVRFTALLHHVSVDRLREAYRALRPDAAAGVDGVTWREYGLDLEANLRDLHARVHRGAYRARPVRRAYIPKADGRSRPLGVAALEDKVLQRAVVEVLNAIYEQDFLGFSYGFRPGRSPHQALDALTVGITRKKVNWVLDADVRDCFTSLDHSWLLKFLEHRIADRRVLRLIQRWLKAGVIEDGEWSQTLEGTPQGASVSTLLANVYLHYVFDLWVHQWRSRHARGDVVVVRFADDFVVGFEHRDEAERFWAELRERFARYGMELHEGKSRLIEFGRFAVQHRARRGDPKPETFDFLGFTHICTKDRRGRFKLSRVTSKKRLRTKLRAVKIEMRRRMHHPLPEQGHWLARVLQGHYNYYGVPHNSRALSNFHLQVKRHWLRSLRRRSQRHRMTWERLGRLADRWLPRPRVMHPWPNRRFDARTQGRSLVR